MPRDGHLSLRWTLPEAIMLCRQIEELCPPFGCHVALTGGTLYKDGARKDVDILFYRIRQEETIDRDGLFDELALQLGIVRGRTCYDWLVKATLNGKAIDFFFPETVTEFQEYEGGGDA